jgi:hypothetical protein
MALIEVLSGDDLDDPLVTQPPGKLSTGPTPSQTSFDSAKNR